jgi:hypothetical protein
METISLKEALKEKFEDIDRECDKKRAEIEYVRHCAVTGIKEELYAIQMHATELVMKEINGVAEDKKRRAATPRFVPFVDDERSQSFHVRMIFGGDIWDHLGIQKLEDRFNVGLTCKHAYFNVVFRKWWLPVMKTMAVSFLNDHVAECAKNGKSPDYDIEKDVDTILCKILLENFRKTTLVPDSIPLFKKAAVIFNGGVYSYTEERFKKKIDSDTDVGLWKPCRKNTCLTIEDKEMKSAFCYPETILNWKTDGSPYSTNKNLPVPVTAPKRNPSLYGMLCTYPSFRPEKPWLIPILPSRSDILPIMEYITHKRKREVMDRESSERKDAKQTGPEPKKRRTGT